MIELITFIVTVILIYFLGKGVFYDTRKRRK